MAHRSPLRTPQSLPSHPPVPLAWRSRVEEGKRPEAPTKGRRTAARPRGPASGHQNWATHGRFTGTRARTFRPQVPRTRGATGGGENTKVPRGTRRTRRDHEVRPREHQGTMRDRQTVRVPRGEAERTPGYHEGQVNGEGTARCGRTRGCHKA